MNSDVMKSLEEEVIEQAPWLLQELGFTIVDAGYDAKHFGNSYVTLMSPSFKLQLVRDRGEIGAEIASPFEPNKWWDLHWISELIPGANYPVPELLAVAAMIRDNYSLFSEYFGSNYRKTKKELKEREEERRQEMLRRFSKA